MLRLFLSYARADDGEPFDPARSFAARLHRDLTAAGFEVWFDRVSMPSRNLTFHQEIRDAVSACDRLVLIVGPRAAASDYVRQEWQFAWFEAEKIVTPILRQGDVTLLPDELKLLHCEDFRDDAQCSLHLANLVRQLSEPAPPLGKLIGVPSLPAHYLSRTDKLIPLREAVRCGLDSPAPFGGTAARQQFHGIAGTSKHVGMHGMGGIGKSVLANLLARDREVRAAFPDGIVWVGLGSVPNLAELMRRVHRELGGDGAFATEPEGKTKLKELLADKALLLVLDDVWRRSDVDPFDVLGPRCRALITTRDAGLLTSLAGTHHLVELLTDDEALHLLAVAADTTVSDLPPEAQQVLRQCGRLPLAVALAGGMVAAGTPWTSLFTAFDRHKLEFFSDEHRPEQHQSLWTMIEISVQALPASHQTRLVELSMFPEDEAVPEQAVATLWQHTGQLDDLDTTQLLIKLKQRSLVQLTSTIEVESTGLGRISLHDLIHDYCLRRAQVDFGNIASLHERLLSAYRQHSPSGWHTGPNDGYFLDHLRTHLVAADRGGELADLLHELPWLEAKNAAGLTFDLPHDFSLAIDALPADDDRRRILKLLDEALRRDIHFIHGHRVDYPQGLFQCLWNSGWWYDCRDAARHHREPWTWRFWERLSWRMKRPKQSPWDMRPETPRPRQGLRDRPLPPWRVKGPKLSTLLQGWRKAREKAIPGFPWLRSLRPPAVPLATTTVAVFREMISGSWSQEYAILKAVQSQMPLGMRSVAWSPDGVRIASSSDNTIRLWEARSGAELLRIPGDAEAAPESFIAKLLRILGDAEASRNFGGAEVMSNRVAWSPDGSRVVDGSRDRVRVWDATTGLRLACLLGHDQNVTSVAWSPDGNRIASGSLDKTVRIWDAAAGTAVACLLGHEGAVSSVAWSPDGMRIASSGEDDTVRVWDAQSGAELLRIQGNADRNSRLGEAAGVASVAWSPDGTRLAGGSSDHTVRVWDAQNGVELLRLRGHINRVASVAWSPDGVRLASGSDGNFQDNTARIWDTRSGAELTCLRGHTRNVESVAWSPNGDRLVTGSSDGTLRVWDPRPEAESCALVGHEAGVRFLRWSPNGRQLVSGCWLGTTRVWDARSGICLRLIRNAGQMKKMTPETPVIRPSNIGQGAVLDSDANGLSVAWLPQEIDSLMATPDGRTLAGHVGNYVWLFALEGRLNTFGPELTKYLPFFVSTARWYAQASQDIRASDRADLANEFERRAIESIERAVELLPEGLRGPWLERTLADPAFDPIRSGTRFQQLLGK